MFDRTRRSPPRRTLLSENAHEKWPREEPLTPYGRSVNRLRVRSSPKHSDGTIAVNDGLRTRLTRTPLFLRLNSLMNNRLLLTMIRSRLANGVFRKIRRPGYPVCRLWALLNTLSRPNLLLIP